MPQSIPPGLKKEHILRTLADLDGGIDHPFGQPTGYELVHDGKRYAPKAVVGLACRYSIGRILTTDLGSNRSWAVAMNIDGGAAKFVWVAQRGRCKRWT